MSIDFDVEALLTPLGDADPCGPNLEYDADFLALEDAAKADAGQEFADPASGNLITIEGSVIDWAQVRKLAEALLARTRDLRVAIYILRALLRTEGFEGLSVGLRLIVGLLEKHWDHVHPQLDAEDDNDPTMRINSLVPLVAIDAVIEDLRVSWLLRSRQSGVLLVRTVEIAQGRLAPAANETVLSEVQLAGMLVEAVAQSPTLVLSLSEASSALKAMSACLQDRIGAAVSIDFKPLETILSCLRTAFAAVMPAAGPGEAGITNGNDETLSVAGVSTGRPGEIRTRQDVLAALGQVVQYLQRTEPTNPAQLLLIRAQRIMNMNFLEAIQELAPEALHQAELMLGQQLNSES